MIPLTHRENNAPSRLLSSFLLYVLWSASPCPDDGAAVGRCGYSNLLMKTVRISPLSLPFSAASTRRARVRRLRRLAPSHATGHCSTLYEFKWLSPSCL